MALTKNKRIRQDFFAGDYFYLESEVWDTITELKQKIREDDGDTSFALDLVDYYFPDFKDKRVWKR